MAVTPSGDLLILDAGYRRVTRVDPGGEIRVRFGSGGDGPEEFEEPAALAADESGACYVLDRGSLRFLKFDSRGNWLWSRPCRDESKALLLSRMCVDADGALLATDAGSDRVHRFDPEGKWLSSWSFAEHTDPSPRAPRPLATDGAGRVAILDQAGARVLLFDVDGALLETWHLPLDSGGQSRHALDLAFGPSGQCVVLTGDPEPALILFDTLGAVTEAASLRIPGSRVKSPVAVAVGREDDIYVADAAGARVLAYDLLAVTRAEAAREEEYAAWLASAKAGGELSALVPLFDDEDTNLVGSLWIARIHMEVSPTISIEMAFPAAFSNRRDEQTLVGNPYGGIRVQSPGSAWSVRLGTQLPMSSLGHEDTRLVAWYADVESFSAFYPYGLLLRPEVTYVHRLGDKWGLSGRGGFSITSSTERGTTQEWIEYGVGARHETRWVRIRGDWAGRWSPFGVVQLPRRQLSYPIKSPAIATSQLPSPTLQRQYGTLDDLQNQLSLRLDFLPGLLRPGVEVRWWAESDAREVVPIVIGGFLEANHHWP